MRVAETVQISAPIERVWDVVADPERVLSFMSGVTRWEVDGDRAQGIGARYRVLFRVGAAEIGGLIEVVESEAPCELAWTSVLGIDQRGRWRLREHGPNRTSVMFRLSYHAPGGLLGWMSDQLSRPMVDRNIRHTLESLKRVLETRRTQAARPKRTKPRAAA